MPLGAAHMSPADLQHLSTVVAHISGNVIMCNPTKNMRPPTMPPVMLALKGFSNVVWEHARVQFGEQLTSSQDSGTPMATLLKVTSRGARA